MHAFASSLGSLDHGNRERGVNPSIKPWDQHLIAVAFWWGGGGGAMRQTAEGGLGGNSENTGDAPSKH